MLLSINSMPILSAVAVARGNSDKVADQISDAILDHFLTIDSEAKVACETMVTKDEVIIGGQLPEYNPKQLEEVVRKTILTIGYKKKTSSFNDSDIKVKFCSSPSEKEIKKSGKHSVKAEDHSVAIGFATNETPEAMPIPILLAREVIHRLEKERDRGHLPFLGLDGQCLVNLSGTKLSIILSFQHSNEISLPELRDKIRPLIPPCDELFINPYGTFLEGGPAIETGLTGRKQVYDAYGPQIPIGGGAFSGKDPSNIDRLGPYFARYLSKKILLQNKLQTAMVHLSFGTGFKKPVSISVSTFPHKEIKIEDTIDVAHMISKLNLNRPIYAKTAYGGHFGHSEFPWESL